MRLLVLGMKQVELLDLLKERGIKTSQSELNLAINGRCTEPRHLRILEGVNAILDEKEANMDVNK